MMKGLVVITLMNKQAHESCERLKILLSKVEAAEDKSIKLRHSTARGSSEKEQSIFNDFKSAFEWAAKSQLRTNEANLDRSQRKSIVENAKLNTKRTLSSDQQRNRARKCFNQMTEGVCLWMEFPSFIELQKLENEKKI